MQTDRNARGTNDPEAAAMQLADGLEAMLALREAELAELNAQVDAPLAGIRDFRTYLVSPYSCTSLPQSSIHSKQDPVYH